MECNKDEAIRARDISLKKFESKDMEGAKKFAQKAQALYSGLDGLPQLMTMLDVYVAAEKKLHGETDWYAVLGVDPAADDDSIRKNYRRLALTLHPDKNKLIGADGAFKILSEAWSLLSDKAKRNAYDHSRNRRNFKAPPHQKPPPPPPPPPPPTAAASAADPRNGFHEFAGAAVSTNSQRSATHQRPPTVPRPVKPKTFWTVCNRCKMQYEYLVNYRNHTLLCPNCREPFIAVETPPPPLNGRKASTPWGAYQQKQNSTTTSASVSATAATAATTPPPPPPPLPNKNHSLHSLFSGYRPGADVAPSRPPNPAVTTKAGVQSDPKKRSAPDESPIPNGAAVNSTGLPRVKEMLTQRELLRDMLVDKARAEIKKKLSEWKQSSSSGCPEPEGKHARVGSPPPPAEEENRSPEVRPTGTEALAMSVPDPDFHDFDKDRTEASFEANHVWAAYDDDDGMPRYYAMVQGVLSRSPLKLRIGWLNSKSNAELGPINWVGCGFAKTCGDYRAGKYETNGSLNSFSHRVRYSRGPRGVIHVYPRKGDVWALYRHWSPDWNELTPDETIHSYDMVEVLEDYAEDRGATVAPLVKVARFRTVFHRHLDPAKAVTIPKEELFRFSHQVPSYLLTGQEAHDAPKGCRELDPAATPLELLTIVAAAAATTSEAESADMPSAE